MSSSPDRPASVERTGRTRHARRLGAAWAACTLYLALALALAGPATAQEAPVFLLDIKGAIGFVSASQVASAIERAQSSNAPALVIRLDTPGGLVSSTREMILSILGSRIP